METLLPARVKSCLSFSKIFFSCSALSNIWMLRFLRMSQTVPCLTLRYLWFSLPKTLSIVRAAITNWSAVVSSASEGGFLLNSKQNRDWLWWKHMETCRLLRTTDHLGHESTIFPLTWYQNRLPPSVNSSLSFSISCFFCSASSSIWMRCCLCRFANSRRVVFVIQLR